MKFKYLIVSNVPAFYKINLYNEINKVFPLKVIFISNSSDIRNSDFIKGEMNFEYEVITTESFEERNKLSVLFKVYKLAKKIQYEYILFPGWEIFELIPLMLFGNKAKNCIVIESSILESKTSGPLWWLKKLIFSRMSHAFPSGRLQSKILEKANYDGQVHVTHGVGLPLRDERIINSDIQIQPADFTYLYVGRISPEKNIKNLVLEFNENGKKLSIVGSGSEFDTIKSLAESNITLYGYVNNSELASIYQSHHFFILPSLSEPWGLVVDEALWYGLPCIVSNNVGCSFDLIKGYNTGLIYDIRQPLNNILETAENNYFKYKENVEALDFNMRDKLQINSYDISNEK